MGVNRSGEIALPKGRKSAPSFQNKDRQVKLADKCRQKTCQNAVTIRRVICKKSNKTSILKN
jgi:hypothetical protein